MSDLTPARELTEVVYAGLVAQARANAKRRRKKLSPAEARAHFGMRVYCLDARCGWAGRIKKRPGERLRQLGCPECGAPLRETWRREQEERRCTRS